MLRSSGGSGLTYHLHPDQGVIAVSSGLDPEGLRKITMSVEESWTCCNGNICSSAAPLWSPIVETQAGSVGSTVSTGIWTGLFVDLPTCNTGYTLTSYRFAWTTKAENFHGGQVTSATHRILYP